MALRERLERMTEILSSLEEGGFMYGLECLSEGSGLISGCVARLQQQQLRRQAEGADAFGRDQFLEDLTRIGMALEGLRPRLLCRVLDGMLDCLDELDGSEDAASMFRTLGEIETRLEQLAAAQVLSRLGDLADVLQDVRPPGGFQPLSYHPSLAARLHRLCILPILRTLEEACHLLFSATNIQHLHLLQHFLHPQHTVPAA